MVTIHFYAGLRELAKVSLVELDWAPGLSVALVRQTIARQIPGINPLLERSSVAVNDVMVANEFVVPDGAEIALLPPVSGG